MARQGLSKSDCEQTGAESTAMMMAGLKYWKGRAAAAQDKACLFEKANFIPKADKKTNITAKKLRVVIKYA